MNKEPINTVNLHFPVVVFCLEAASLDAEVLMVPLLQSNTGHYFFK